MINPTLHCPCEGRYRETGFLFNAPPAGETAFDMAGAYSRSYDHCTLCRHWFSRHEIDLAGLYGGAYVDNTYGSAMRATYERIMMLPPERSDNSGRVDSVFEFARGYLHCRPVPKLLDVGSGLAVFPARMREIGWQCTALDPDPRAAIHAHSVAGVDSITGDFMTLDLSAMQRKFDVVTFNKVLEHVEDPVAMLARAVPLLADGGFVYLELPDGEAASAEGQGREEFFIEHHHVFSPESVLMLTRRAGFRPLKLERLREPSTKYTIRLFGGVE